MDTAQEMREQVAQLACLIKTYMAQQDEAKEQQRKLWHDVRRGLLGIVKQIENVYNIHRTA